MPILSERKGVNNWLKGRGVSNNEFQSFVIKTSPFKFYHVGYKPHDSNKFQKFVEWFLQQDLKQLRRDWVEHKANKAVQKLEKEQRFVESDFYKIFVDTELKRNVFRKTHYPKMRWNRFTEKWNMAVRLYNSE